MSLKKGQRFTMDGYQWRVAYVNASRAHCVATKRATVTIKGRTFTAKRKIATDISPNTCVELLS